jgi:NAD(P)-dependent dehydrogenase (short-subunit alcohol dehydrogenase family)
MAQKLAGKVAVVTGAGSEVGIGKEVALAMAAEGAKVVVNDIAKDADGSWGADRVVKEIQKANGTAVANYDSVASMEGSANIIKAATSNFGHIDILVNTAGNYKEGPTADYSEADWDAVIAVHLKGLFACTRAAVEEMIKQGSGGRIINFTSIAGFATALGPPFEVTGPAIAYCTAKAGVLGFTKVMSQEAQKYGITVNVISPQAKTKLFPIADEPGSGVPSVGPEYVAPVVVYLAADEAKDVTGQIIFAGGGDVAVMTPPIQTPGPHQFVHKSGKWTVDELIDIIPRMVKK